ncbi:acetate--CoA ligase family protein [Caenimonas sp. SL110]|uniref:acetate--CoA ligase family protein n=1 Tax=Caenimonas sp. SL110 TaxID=1450524 RepID=UPI0006545DDB|nr:acetate--CoA ligase family protein [Caenimonas sp. SL110]
MAVSQQGAFTPRESLVRALSPRSVAVVGASNRPGSFGQRTLDNLASYAGTVYMVSKTAAELSQGRTYPSLSDLPQVPDCVVLATPGEIAEPLVQECASIGVGGVIVYASGFGEVGDTERQQRLGDIARRSGMALFGPNCLGVANHTLPMVLSFADFTDTGEAVTRGVGVISQSGAVGIALSQARRRGVAISHVLTFGNASNVDTADLIAYLAHESACAAIACVFEGCADPLRIVEAARVAAAHDKVVVMYKAATSEQGAAAAISHTGSLAGSDSAYRAVLRSAGVVLVDSLEALLETATFFAKAPAPRALGAAIVSSSGGTGIMATDKAEENGIALPQPDEATLAILNQHIPSYGSARNPCDLTAQVLGNPHSLAACCAAFTDSDAYGVLVTTQPWAAPALAGRVQVYEEAARRSGKPVCTVWVSQWHEGPGAIEFERSPLVPVFHSMERCFAAIRAWHDYHAWKQSRHSFSEVAASQRAQAAALLADSQSPTLGEREAKQLLALYGVPVVTETLATSQAQAVAAADTAGYPVVLKIESPDVLHKSDIGGVRLNLRSSQDVLQAYADMMAAVSKAAPAARIDGVLVQPMIHAGVELIVGARQDPQFGPLLVVGLGGIFVELIADVSVAPVPVSREQALAMLRGLRAAPALQGARGLPKVDLERLADIVSRISLLVDDVSGQLLELDVNPIICGHHGHIHAVDALVVRRQEVRAPRPEGAGNEMA